MGGMQYTTARQHPIGSPFDAASTVDDVLAGIDLTGRNVVITGGHTGLGLEMTRGLSRAGASVTVAARNPDRAAEALDGLKTSRPTGSTWWNRSRSTLSWRTTSAPGGRCTS